MKKILCGLLILLMAWTPFQAAQAGMIGTEQAVSASSQSDRSAVLGFVSRNDVASQLQSFGLDPSTAKDRVAAMTDEEARSLAGRIDAMPAGANGFGLVILVGIVFVIWWISKR